MPILMLMFKVYTFMLDAFLVMYDAHSYSNRDAFNKKIVNKKILCPKIVLHSASKIEM